MGIITKSRACYQYEITNMHGRNVIIITDNNSGCLSVTNDIDNIIREIAAFNHINASAYMIVYKDSDNIWDGYDFVNSAFILLHETCSSNAIRKYIQLQLNTDIH